MNNLYKIYCNYGGKKLYITYPGYSNILSPETTLSNLYSYNQTIIAVKMATKLFGVKFEIELAQGL